METKFNFKSQVCTDKNQSECLLALGLKKETADMVHYFSQSLAQDWTIVPLADGEVAKNVQGLEIPAWSLHRLLSLIPKNIEFQVSSMYGRNCTLTAELQITCELDICYIEPYGEEYKSFYGADIYDSAIRCIEWLIKEGYFNEDYLEETL